MEYVGKPVKKEFSGFGVFKGVVESYDSSTGFFRIAYEDGDSEDLDLSEVSLLIHPASAEPIGGKVTKKVGWKPEKKRRIAGDPGKVSHNLVVNSMQSSGNLEIQGGLGQNLNEAVYVHGTFDNVVVGENRLGLNLNDGFNLDDGFHELVDFRENVGVRGCIDLNTTVDKDFVEKLCGDETGCFGLEMQKIERGFDLNLGFNNDRTVLHGENEVPSMDVQILVPKMLNSLDQEQINVESPCFNRLLVCNRSVEHLYRDGCIDFHEELVHRNGFKDESGNTFLNVVDASDLYCKELRDSHSDAITLSRFDDENCGPRKKRKTVNNLGSPSETVLRRSMRRASMSTQNNDSGSVIADGTIEMYSGVSLVSEEKPAVPECEVVEDSKVLPPRVELPPSSTNLNLDGIPAIEIFSIYSFLRSFSTLLYLSPFELEDLVAALKSKVSNSLLDFIHVSILQTLRKHLEFLSSEGSESASSCLRNLNWDLLDVVTWPIFMVEYLLIHGSGLKPGFDLGSLKLFENDYYKLSAEVKIEMLRCLCDDVMEVGVIRSELNKRSTLSHFSMDIDRNVNNDVFRKRRPSIYAFGDSGSSEDAADDTTDWNSDECCLCKMDGILICCDGCPAAYHSRCVGVVSSLLPEGKWYCPECSAGQQSSGVNPQKLIRGAELLEVDPYGRFYFSSCGYLLVSDTFDAESSVHYYHRNDLSLVIEVLRSSEIAYQSILSVIIKHWALYTVSNEHENKLDTENLALSISPVVSVPLRSSGASNNCVVSGNLDLMDSAAVKPSKEMENPVASSEGSAEVLQAGWAIQCLNKVGFDQCHGTSNCANASGGDLAVKTPILPAKRGRRKTRSAASCRKYSVIKEKEEETLQMQTGSGYMNLYSFAQTAASVAEALTHKSLNKINQDFTKSEDEIISAQLKAIIKKSSKSHCLLDLDVKTLKEKCGWCYSCRSPAEDRDCLFNISHTGSVPEVLKNEIAGLQSKGNKKGHLVDIICHILSMEYRLRGLLLGPWLNPHYSNLWHKNIIKASDVASLKRCLLTLESSLRPLALSAEWWKHVDSAAKMGSASHFVTNSRVNSRLGLSRKRGQGADLKPIVNAGGGLGLFWWRGGQLSRKLFNWKLLPHSLASKAARKGGSMKIPGVLYSDSSEYAKRSKHVVWRSAVETSVSVLQLALQVRELDLNIRWNDIENTNLHSKLDKELNKSLRLFKKVIIRRKCVVETAFRYLLDFGKRRIIPDVVLRHGIIVEDSSSERKKYWLDESYIPLHLLKSFEEKRIARKAGKMIPNKVLNGGKEMKKPFTRKGLEYLSSRAERARNYPCGLCKNDVSIREAVSCQYCSGFFHKRHAKKLSGTITAKCKFVCHRCDVSQHIKIGRKGRKCKFQKSQDGKSVKVGNRRRKAKSKKVKKASTDCRQLPVENSKKMQVHEVPLHSQDNTNTFTGVTLRRSARKRKYMSVQYDELGEDKKGKQEMPRIVKSKNPSGGWFRQRKRTEVLRTFWRNGLLFSRKPNDELVMDFKRRKIHVPSEFLTDTIEQIRCSLCCEDGYSYKSPSTYIACEICGGWFHGQAFGLDSENIQRIIGFRCHICLKRNPPVCPYVEDARTNSALLSKSMRSEGPEIPQESSATVVVPMETDGNHNRDSDEDLQGSLQLDVAVQTLAKASSDSENGQIIASEDQIVGAVEIHNEEHLEAYRGSFSKMEALYAKLYEKYTRLKARKDSELDLLNHDQEVKFINFTTASDELMSHLQNENDKLRADIEKLRNEVVSLRAAKDQQYVDYEKMLLEEREKSQQFCIEIKGQQCLQQEGLCPGVVSHKNEDLQLCTPQYLQIVSGDQSNGSTRRTGRKRGRSSKQPSANAGNEPALSLVEHPTANKKGRPPEQSESCVGNKYILSQAENLATREVSADLSEETTSDMDLQQPHCCRRNINSSGLSNCVFHGLVECLIGMKVSIALSDGLCLRALHQSSGYSFSLAWVDKASTDEAELLYRVSSLGTFERVAPEWMREDIMFSMRMCPTFFDRVSRVIGLAGDTYSIRSFQLHLIGYDNGVGGVPLINGGALEPHQSAPGVGVGVGNGVGVGRQLGYGLGYSSPSEPYQPTPGVSVGIRVMGWGIHRPAAY
ncbi:hypothetical protein Nepgr_013304 [Nepenthes gracilis]|uniref:Uncharacterized protein n=1 Tax=Nepenthes gracilis TaxID=150966 RepID=A0AAD3SHM0_NEPGR|nr:hypothetical protein Nepgr_013304 [Nepenthes gracilis]